MSHIMILKQIGIPLPLHAWKARLKFGNVSDTTVVCGTQRTRASLALVLLASNDKCPLRLDGRSIVCVDSFNFKSYDYAR